MRAAIVGAAVAAIVAGGTVAMAPRAEAATPGCMTRPEFSRIHRGMTPAKVATIVGAAGKVQTDDRSPGYRYLSKVYRVCGSRYGSALVAWDTTSATGSNTLGVYAKGFYA